MATMKEILDREQNRNLESLEWCTIYLYPEGTFLRAHEWSAWLCVRYLKDFKVTRRLQKVVERDVCFVGFPVTSLDKWAPDPALVTRRDDGSIDLVLPAEVQQGRPQTADMTGDFTQWRNSIPITEAQPKKEKARQNGTGGEAPESVHESLTAIMQQVMAFPIESRSPMECMLFLSELKKKLAPHLH